MSQPQQSDWKRQVHQSHQVPSFGKPVHSPAQPSPLSQAASSSSAPPPASPAAKASSLPNSAKKKKHKAEVVWSQPSDTGTGIQRGTQLAFALDYLKKSQNPIRLEDLAVYSNVPSLITDATLLAAFESDPNVNKNPNNGLYTWKRVYASRTPEQLLNEIRTKGRDGGGLSVKQLKEGFPDVVQHIEELERQGHVLVTRATKDNQPKHVFWNEITVEQGGKQVDEEFRKLWDGLANPVEADILRSLERDGLQATASETLPAKQLPKKRSKKPKTSNRVHKITNTHIADVDLTKDFVKPTT
ncbi:hypothetical protein FRB99_000587 [Tulasnella sp. 403]|nr:hypothetical protein FRB99_000587 [Tulasnella sp. 403]